MIHAVNASLTYPDGTMALKPFNLKVSPGETVMITGPSGSGKTSLLKLILGMVFVSTGSLEVLGQPMTGSSHALRSVRQRIGPVFQEFRLLEGRSVLENVVLGMRFLDIPNGELRDRAVEAIDRVGLESKLHQSVDRLSWGECQRVAIARAVSRKPALIIADEPTGNLDHDNALNILTLLTSFSTADTGVVITTHATHLLDFNQAGTYIRMRSGSMSIERRE